MATIGYDNLQSELVKYGTLLVEKYKAQLKIDGTQATGDTEKSLRYSVDIGQLEILADKSIEYIDEGRKPGEAPPVSDILKWAESKNLRPRSKNGAFASVNNRSMFWMASSISKAIGEKGTIKRFGYKGSGIIEFVYLNQKDEMLNNIFAAYGRDVQEVIDQIVKQQ